MRVLADKEFTWNGDDLMFQREIICSLVKHKTIEKHWHLKFSWRDEKTPEFFNIFNARENARVYSRKHAQGSLEAASLMRLNEKDRVR